MTCEAIQPFYLVSYLSWWDGIARYTNLGLWITRIKKRLWSILSHGEKMKECFDIDVVAIGTLMVRRERGSLCEYVSEYLRSPGFTKGTFAVLMDSCKNISSIHPLTNAILYRLPVHAVAHN